MSTNSQTAIHFATVLWGRDYTELFCRLGLRSQLAPDNLPSLAGRYQLHYHLYAPDEDIAHIRTTPAWRELQLHAAVHLEKLPPEGRDKYDRVSRAHILASNEAARLGGWVGFLAPDCLYSNGSLGGLAAHVEAGAEAVMTLGLRANREPVLGWLGTYIDEKAPALNVSPRDTVSLTLKHLHAIEKGMFWGEKEHSRLLSHVYFRLDENGFLAYCWHLHPLLVKPARVLPVQHPGTIDGGTYLETVLSNPDRTAVVTDSDQFFSMELSAPDLHVAPHHATPISVPAMAKWARYNTTTFNRQLLRQAVWVHATPPSARAKRQKDELDQLLQSTVIAPVLRLTRLRSLYRPVGTAATLARKAVRRVRSFDPRRVLRHIAHLPYLYTHKATLRLLRHSALAHRFATRLGAGALRLASKARPDELAVVQTEARELAARQRQLTIDLLRHGAIEDARASMGPLHAGAGPAVQSDLFATAINALNQGRLEVSRHAMQLAVEVQPTPENQFYLLLLDTLQRLKADAEERATTYAYPGPRQQRYVFSAVVWGNDYIDNFMRYTMRSLLAPGNLPALAGDQVYFTIITTPSGEERIRQAACYPLLERHARVVFFTFPEELTHSFHYSRPTFDYYRLYGALDHTSIHFARALKAHIFFIVVDGLLSNNSIGSLKRFLAEGYDICANASIVSDRETLLPALDERYGDLPAIDINARDLANIGFTHRHHYISQRLVVPENRNFDLYPRELYFPTEEGLVVHALYQHPLVISAKALGGDIQFDYFIVDSKLMARIMDDPSKFEKLKVVTDSNDVYVANFAPRDRKFESTGRALNINDFISVHLESEPIHHYIWKHRQLIRCDTRLRTHMDPEQVADRFLFALKKALKRIGR